MFLRQVRADQQQQTSDFRLRKPKRTRVKSSNISSHVLSSDTTSPFTNININSQIHKKNKTPLQPEDTLHEENRTPLQPEDTLHEENRTPLQPEDTPINENDDLYSIFDNNGNFFNDPNDSDDFYNNSGDDQETNREFNEKAYDGNKKQNHYSRNEAGPYFPNYTMLLLFLWIIKHQIVVYGLSDFITYYDVHTSETYYGRIISILHIDDSQDMCIKIECILEFDSLPSILKSKHRKVASQDGCLWMTDDTLIIKPANIISKVTGGLGVITSNLPEGNEQAGVKNHNAYYGCRNCMIHHNNLHDISFDIAKYGRYHHKTTLQFAEVRNVQTQTERDFLTMEYGIRENPSVFDNVMRDWHLQCPHDAFHCMGGIAKEMLQATFEILTAVIDRLLNLWISFSKMVYLVFRKEFSENCYNNLQQSLMQWAIQVAKIFPNITRLPNFHIQCHFIMHAKHFATLVNTAVSTKEMMHRLYKGIVPHSNKKDIELDFVRRDNCL
ncbi:unnamed protein product [Rhizophagus irregularis]|nr:unnamed protein product [Rhizophagus irregularis]